MMLIQYVTYNQTKDFGDKQLFYFFYFLLLDFHVSIFPERAGKRRCDPSTVETNINNMMTNAPETLLRGHTLSFSALSAAEVASRVRASAPPPLRF